MELQLYDHLLRFQLFQGMSRSELLQMAGNTKFGFLKERSGTTIANAGDDCRQLFFLINGSMELTTASDDGACRIVERLHAPWVLQPEALFGLQTRYAGTWRTASDCHFITLSKDEVLRLLDDFLVVRLNLLNMLAALAQRRDHRFWRRPPLSLRQRFVRFVLDRCTYPAGAKTLRVLMTHLAADLGDSRLNISRMLNALQRDGLVELHRGSIVVHSLERLLTSN